MKRDYSPRVCCVGLRRLARICGPWPELTAYQTCCRAHSAIRAALRADGLLSARAGV